MTDSRPGTAAVALTREEQAALDRTVAEINAGLFFEAHETLEHAWTHCTERHRIFLQAIIHVAVGAYHGSRGNGLGMERQFAKALRKLQGFLPVCAGIDTQRLKRTVEWLIEQGRASGHRGLRIPLPLVYPAA